MYQPRTYRHWVRDQDLTSFRVEVKETDLHIRATTNLRRKALRLVLKYRGILERYIERYPLFLTSLGPLPVSDRAPHIIRLMAESTARVGVGPMASVAGAIAEFVGNELLTLSREVIIENGGDIFLRSLKTRSVGIYAGKSPLTGRVGLEIDGQDTPLGICTSSGTVGHSLSFGKADAVVTISRSPTFADATATAIGNTIVRAEDIERGIEFASSIEGLLGAVIIKDDKIALWGKVKICQTSMHDINPAPDAATA
jgi:ApbE superfamily uncharacterized protein (UPF0280 family)